MDLFSALMNCVGWDPRVQSWLADVLWHPLSLLLIVLFAIFAVLYATGSVAF
jgi:hypothetical protein